MDKCEKLKEDLRNYIQNNKFYKTRIARKKAKLKQSTVNWEIRMHQRELRELEDKLSDNRKNSKSIARDLADYYFENEGVI